MAIADHTSKPVSRLLDLRREQFGPLRRSGMDVEATMAANLLGRVGVPDDVARVVLFAVSDMVAFVTGSTILADAGSLAGR